MSDGGVSIMARTHAFSHITFDKGNETKKS